MVSRLTFLLSIVASQHSLTGFPEAYNRTIKALTVEDNYLSHVLLKGVGSSQRQIRACGCNCVGNLPKTVRPPQQRRNFCYEPYSAQWILVS